MTDKPLRQRAPHTLDYLMRDIPQELWDRFKLKAESIRPPTSMKWIILQLVEKYLEDNPRTRASAKQKTRKTLRKEARLRAPVGDAPELGDVF